jgi:hypothetical protein
MKLFCDIIVNTSNNDYNDPFSTIILTMLFEVLKNNNLQFTTKTKFDQLETILNNKQIIESTKHQIIVEFCNSQRICWILKRFFKKYHKLKVLQSRMAVQKLQLDNELRPSVKS